MAIAGKTKFFRNADLVRGPRPGIQGIECPKDLLKSTNACIPLYLTKSKTLGANGHETYLKLSKRFDWAARAESAGDRP